MDDPYGITGDGTNSVSYQPLSKRSLSNGMVQPFSQLQKLSTISKDVHWLDLKVFSTKFDKIKGKNFQPDIYVKNQPNG